LAIGEVAALEVDVPLDARCFGVQASEAQRLLAGIGRQQSFGEVGLRAACGRSAHPRPVAGQHPRPRLAEELAAEPGR
jgi:hypothetical protein